MLFQIKQRHRLLVSIAMLGMIVISSTIGPLISKYEPSAQYSPSTNNYSAPSSRHWFGTDHLGRDVFVRVLQGGRISLAIAGAVVFLSMILGTLYGAFSAYLGGPIDRLLMRLVDLLLAFPIVFLVATCISLFGSDIFWLIIVLTMTSWMDVARLVRGEVHSLKQRPFILKARSVGLNTGRIVFRHLVPNVMATVLVMATLRAADIILIESALSFLGLGVQPPVASWGSIINDGKAVLAKAWWLTTFPGLAIIATIVSLNTMNEALQGFRK